MESGCISSNISQKKKKIHLCDSLTSKFYVDVLNLLRVVVCGCRMLLSKQGRPWRISNEVKNAWFWPYDFPHICACISMSSKLGYCICDICDYFRWQLVNILICYLKMIWPSWVGICTICDYLCLDLVGY